MKAYIIKVTYLSGRHKGNSYFMRKGGYVADLDMYFSEDSTYATERIAKMVCTKLFNNNELCVESERSADNYRKSKGENGKEWFVYEHESYEPYAVEI